MHRLTGWRHIYQRRATKGEEEDASPVFSNVLETRKDPVPR